MELEVEGRRPRGRHESHSCIVLYQLLDCQQFQNPYITIPALQFNTSRALHPAVIYIESMDATVLVEYLPITATIFTTRCYARVVYAIVICPIHPSVCPSQASLVSKWLDKSSWFWHKGFLPPISPTVYYKEIWVPPKIGVLPSGALSGTLDLENSATASPSHCRLNSLTVKQVDDTYMTVDESQLFTTHQSAVTL